MTTPSQSSILIQPWFGSNYDKSPNVFRQRTLILGGSHYSDEYESFHKPEHQQEWSTMTIDIVECYLDENIRDTWKKTYSTFINSVYGAPANHDQRRDFFESVVFYNYLQDIAGAGPKDAANFNYGDPRHFAAFSELLVKHRPDVVIAWGNKVWNALPNDWGYGPVAIGSGVVIGAGKSKDIYDYPFDGATIRLVGVNHPSIGYDVGFHHELFKHLDLIA